MASIRPFTGLRYSSLCGPIDSLTAPPYDVLSQAQRDEYASREPHNVVHLTLPEQHGDDRSKFVKYMRSSTLLNGWRKDGSLKLEDCPVLYRYVQDFSIPGSSEVLRRSSVIALIKVEPYDKGIVLPHEQTFPKHKEDRMRILETTRAHLECIFGLFDDPSGDILAAIQSAPCSESVETHSDEGVTHFLEPITDPGAIQAIVDLMSDKKVWIADGHHRYETALAYREGMGEKSELIPEDFMMMALCSISDPGLVLLPTHRMLKSSSLSKDEILTKLGEVFEMRQTSTTTLMYEIEKIGTDGNRAFGMAFDSGVGYVMTEKSPGSLVSLIQTNDSDELKDLDVSILHQVILQQLLGVKGLEQIAYTRDPEEAANVSEHGAVVSFLMNPPTVDDMKSIATAGEKMPQKSTYYYPKVLSGLVIWSLNDF